VNPTPRQLQVFEAVARCQSYTRAARELFLTQPAVSMQIGQLETAIGLPLFEQIGKKIYLTDAGRELQVYGRRLAQLMGELEEVMEGFKGVKRGRLAISVATTANHFATRILADFSKRYSGLALRLDVTNRESLLRQLQNNECDLVIMGQPPEEEGLKAEPFLPNPLMVIASVQHPLATMRKIPLARLADETLLVRESGSGTRGAAQRFFKQHGIRIRLGMELRSSEAIKQAVEAGLGIAVVSWHTVELELQASRLAVLDVEGFPIKRHWYLAQNRDKRLAPAAKAFKDYVLKYARKYVSLPGRDEDGD